jgi:hypothetical protein
MNYNNDFKHDLEVGQVYEKELGNLLQKKVEVKRDFRCLETKNVFVEYESRGKPSGIATSEADYYCFWFSDVHCVIIKTHKLKEHCRKWIGTNRDVLGGDNNTSKGILLPITIFFENIY